MNWIDAFGLEVHEFNFTLPEADVTIKIDDEDFSVEIFANPAGPAPSVEVLRINLSGSVDWEIDCTSSSGTISGSFDESFGNDSRLRFNIDQDVNESGSGSFSITIPNFCSCTFSVDWTVEGTVTVEPQSP